MKLNLSQFKKTADDKDHAVLKHSAGHEFKIAKKALSKEMRKELETIPLHKAEGGDINPNQELYDQVHLAQKQVHNPDYQPNAQESANQNKYFSNVAGAVAGSMAPGEGALAEKAALNTTYDAALAGKATAQDTAMAAQKANRAADFAQRNAKAAGQSTRGKSIDTRMAEGGAVGKPCLNPNCKSHGQPHPNCKCYGYAEGGRVSSGGCQCCLQDLKQNDLAKNSGQVKMAYGGPTMASTAQDSPDQIAQDAAPSLPPQSSTTPALPHPNDYAKIYSQIYAQQKVNNPGQPDQMARDTALDTATSTQKADQIKAETEQFNKEQAATNQVNHDAVENQRRAQIGLPPINSPAGTVPPQGEAPTEADPANVPAQGSNANPQDSFMGNMQKAYGLQKQGIEEGAKAIGDLGNQKADVLGQQSAADRDLLEKTQASQQKAMQEHERFVQDVKNGYINPNQYIGSMGSGQKVATAVGLLLSGMGSGLAHQDNLAFKFLNDQIDRDVHAQATNLAQKNNLLAHNIQMLNSVQDGYKLTHAQMASMYAHQIDQAAAHAMAPQAKAAADQAKGELLGKSAMFLGQIGIPGASGQQNSMDNYLNMMRMVNPERAKEIETRYVPGMGIASVPLSEDTRKTLIGKQQLADASKDMYDWAAKHSGALSLADIGIGQIKAANLQNMYRGAMNGGVYKKGEQEFIDQIIDSNPTKFFNEIRVLPKLREVMNQNALSTQGLKKAYGMSGPAGNASQAGPSGFQPKSFRPAK